jgi:hypothetical protein
MKKTCLLAVAAGLACCSIAVAKPPLKKARPGAEMQPISIAKVMKVNGKYVRAGDWIPYTGNTARGAPVSAPFYDCFGREPGTAPAGTAGTNCVPTCDTAPDGGGRWFFGSSYHIPACIDDMQDCACPPGSVISEIDLGWEWCPSTAENCILVYFPLEEVLDKVAGLCNDPASFTGTGGGGVAINFGAPAPSCPGFYYYSRVVGIDGIGILSPGTDDNGDANGYADGSYELLICNSVTSTELVLCAGPTQAMLWGTSQGYLGSSSTGPADCRPGLNNDSSYDDDAPADAVYSNPAECYDNNYGVCPDPLGKDNAFCFMRCPADHNGDGFVDGSDSDKFNNEFAAAAGFNQMCADLNGDCFVDGSDSDYFNNEFDTGCP